MVDEKSTHDEDIRHAIERLIASPVRRAVAEANRIAGENQLKGGPQAKRSPAEPTTFQS